MAKTDLVADLVAPILEAHDADLYDVTFNGGKLVVAVTRDGGIDLDSLAEISRALSARLDEEDPIQGGYTLEVSSPGLERTLRTPGHFAGAVGAEVTVKRRPGDGDRRVRGVLVEAGDERIVVDAADPDGSGTPVGRVEIAIADIDKARTVFTWGDAQSKPSGTTSGKKPKPSEKEPR